MQIAVRRTSPDIWIDQIFSTKAARRGAVVRRSVAWVEREIGHDRFVAEIRSRGYHLVRTADQFIVICHAGPIDILF